MSTKLSTTGDFTSRLSAAYASHIAALEGGGGGDGKEQDTADSTKLARALAQADLSISNTEAADVLKAATSTSSQRATEEAEKERGGECVRWGEFCVCCAELVSRKHEQAHSQGQTHKHSGRRVRKRPSPLSHQSLSQQAALSCKYDVFLGGSCNPTSWRKDVVIPYLLKEGITYYNPQVDEWYPELIDIEEQAKKAASKLFFVIDDQTRAVASMVEVAYFVGNGRDLLVVVDDITGDAPAIGGDRLSHREVEDLNRGRAFVRSVTDEGGCLLEATIHKAVSALVDVSRWGQCAPEDSPSQTPDGADQVSLEASFTAKLKLLQQVYTMHDTERRGHLTVDEADLALRSLGLDQKTVETLWKENMESRDWSQWKQKGISLEDFCVLYAEAKHRSLGLAQAQSRGLLSATAEHVRGGLQRLSGWLWSSPSPPVTTGTPPHPPHTHCNLYLGGSCGATSWRHDDIIPILHQYGVTFFNPQVSQWDNSLISIEQSAKDQCSVLLFVIGGDTLSVASMVEVAYYIGCGRRLVLALTDITQPQDSSSSTALEGMKLSQRAVRDYNRGRAYLASIARNMNVPTYTTTTDAALAAVYMVKGYQLPSEQTVPLQGTSV